MKKKGKVQQARPVEKQYLKVFSPHPLPFQGLYTDEDSLEQPSALKYVPTTATPSVEDLQLRLNAELERSIR
jgi:hypothetical protein